MKTVIWALWIFGGALLLLGVISQSGGVAIVGALTLIAGVVVAAKSVETLNKEQVIDNWSILLDGGAGKAEAIFQETNNFIKATKPPGMQLERRKIATSVLSGERRDFLVATDLRSGRLQPYQMFICAQDYGTQLMVDWNLTYRPPIWKAVVSLLLAKIDMGNPLLDLSLFDQHDFRSYVTNAHGCLLRAVENLILTLEQDPTKIERKSRGFLGIS